jgi:hypothetical protein
MRARPIFLQGDKEMATTSQEINVHKEDNVGAGKSTSNGLLIQIDSPNDGLKPLLKIHFSEEDQISGIVFAGLTLLSDERIEELIKSAKALKKHL